MRKNLLKRLALGALLAGALTSYAATLEKTDVEGWNWKVTIDDVVIVPGDSVEVPILVTNDHEFIGFQTDIVLTEGLELHQFVTWNEDDEEWNRTFFEKTARFKSTHVVESSHPFADHWRYITYSNKNSTYKLNEGPIGVFKLYAKPTLASDGEIKVNRLYISANNIDPQTQAQLGGRNVAFITNAAGAPDTLSEVKIADVFLGSHLSTVVGGKNNTDYRVVDNMAVAYAGPTFAILTDGEGNWIRVEADLTELQNVKGAYGTLTNVETNPTLTLKGDLVAAEEEVGFEVASYDLADAFAPKANELVDITGYYLDGQLKAYSAGAECQGQDLTLDMSVYAGNNAMTEGQQYKVRGVISLKEAWSGAPRRVAADDEFSYKNYTLTVTDVPATPTGITKLVNGKEVQSVRYYNAAGIESTQPFDGVNIVVTRFNDGSTQTVKVIK